MDKSKRVWIYCRTAHPDEEMLKLQKQRLINAAHERGYEIVGTTVESGSGLTLKRDGMEEVFAAADVRRMDAVFTVNSTRIARNISELTDCIFRLNKQEIELLTLDTGVVKVATACLRTWGNPMKGLANR